MRNLNDIELNQVSGGNPYAIYVANLIVGWAAGHVFNNWAQAINSYMMEVGDSWEMTREERDAIMDELPIGGPM